MTIYFYSTKDAYGEFSNFKAYPFELKGKTWRTVEHYFQAQKFAGTEHEEELRETPSPMVVARKGRSRKRPLRTDWEEVKDQIMREAVYAKFEQHAELEEMLLNTGDNEIVEQTTRDYYWGCGSEGTGKNMLGIILMETRERLLSRQTADPKE
ncbi:NADAR family protein [Gimesia algae]|uniref:Swarming motility protein YbiA n=1 Tax=Gimesia algae TaxID=2527971 RepID=A0A517VGM0_9PLAN|nr:NADAR family protein [Gimesia algae]QDT92161.1 Swarming motility protein YbiA [Gimesia algae]